MNKYRFRDCIITVPICSTIRVTVKSPKSVNVCEGLGTVLPDVPSPKSHSQELMVWFTVEVEFSSKLTELFIHVESSSSSDAVTPPTLNRYIAESAQTVPC